MPLLRLRQRNVLFYCHYPDKLLSTDRKSFLKRFYRFFLDLIEELTTGLAKCIVVNSRFTQKVFSDNFPLIRKLWGYRPEVVYPSIDERTFQKSKGMKETIETVIGRKVIADKTIVLTSLNRYERKKNIPLALEAFAYYINNQLKGKDNSDPVLVVAGGYDPRLQENVQVHDELKELAQDLGISDKVVFLRSISND